METYITIAVSVAITAGIIFLIRFFSRFRELQEQVSENTKNTQELTSAIDEVHNRINCIEREIHNRIDQEIQGRIDDIHVLSEQLQSVNKLSTLIDRRFDKVYKIINKQEITGN